ncbi:MAG: hypothetical protein HC855_11685 [Rhizobiales bacterium]|nr:hypothetical protein [Hyphomicrobiales bacterium]
MGQLAPRDVARCSHFEFLRLLSCRIAEEQERRARRIGDHRESADARNVHRLLTDLAAEFCRLLRVGIDILGRDVAIPHGRTVFVCRRRRHHAANLFAIHCDDPVVHARHAGIGNLPAHDLLIEARGGFHVWCHEIVPTEFGRHVRYSFACGLRHDGICEFLQPSSRESRDDG